jgi:hypothetical protein
MTAGKTWMIVLGAVLTLVSLCMGVAGGTLLWANAVGRDADGFFSTSSERFGTSTYAITSQSLADVHNDARGDWLPFDVGTARVEARGVGDKPLFIGVAEERDIDSYLSAVPHDEVADFSSDTDAVTYEHLAGSAVPAPPGSQNFWIASATGSGALDARWDFGEGSWEIVAMNADGSPGVALDAAAGLNTDVLFPTGFALLGFAAMIASIATVLFVVALRGREAALPVEHHRTIRPAVSPLHFRGNLDAPLGRGRWLVKWLLAIPHLIVLAVLWCILFLATVGAGMAVLFTGRYPRSLFEFNVGVMRWTWRVSFYAFMLGTDRYPPFSPRPDPTYPADLSVDYSDHLSQPLVLVKWWLLAIPHYLIVSLFGGGLTFGAFSFSDNSTQGIASVGLIGILALVAGFALLFGRGYPRSIFDFVMGMQRWSYRVFAYAALMTDAYPPFRLDTGEKDPPAVAESSPVPKPTTPRPSAGVAPA